MKLFIVNSKGKFDISELVTTISWSGEKTQVARMIEFSIIHNPSNSFIPKVEIELGNKVQLLDANGVELFRGNIWSREKTSGTDDMQFTAYDIGIGLLRNKVIFNFKNKTAEEITNTVCKSIGCPTGTIISTGVKLSRIFDSTTAYEAIQSAYTIASMSTGKQYMPIVTNDKLNIIEKGAKLIPITLQEFDNNSGAGNIISSTYSDTLENMVNKVVIVSEEGKVISTLQDANNIKLYGTMQEIFKKSKDTDNTPDAKALLKGVEQTASLEALGITECITGNAVMVKDTHTGLVGKFFIDSDSHTFEGGVHKMKLNISFKNLMDSVVAGEIEEAKKATEKKEEDKKKKEESSKK